MVPAKYLVNRRKSTINGTFPTVVLKLFAFFLAVIVYVVYSQQIVVGDIAVWPYTHLSVMIQDLLFLSLFCRRRIIKTSLASFLTSDYFSFSAGPARAPFYICSVKFFESIHTNFATPMPCCDLSYRTRQTIPLRYSLLPCLFIGISKINRAFLTHFLARYWGLSTTAKSHFSILLCKSLHLGCHVYPTCVTTEEDASTVTPPKNGLMLTVWRITLFAVIEALPALWNVLLTAMLELSWAAATTVVAEILVSSSVPVPCC